MKQQRSLDKDEALRIVKNAIPPEGNPRRQKQLATGLVALGMSSENQKRQKFRLRLLEEHDKLVRSVSRKRSDEAEIRAENTEDEGDLSVMSHDRDLLYDLSEAGSRTLKEIGQALKRLDSGSYGVCARCANDINEKRLEAVPWATLCITCQEGRESEEADLSLVPAGSSDDEDKEN